MQQMRGKKGGKGKKGKGKPPVSFPEEVPDDVHKAEAIAHENRLKKIAEDIPRDDDDALLEWFINEKIDPRPLEIFQSLGWPSEDLDLMCDGWSAEEVVKFDFFLTTPSPFCKPSMFTPQQEFDSLALRFPLMSLKNSSLEVRGELSQSYGGYLKIGYDYKKKHGSVLAIKEEFPCLTDIEASILY